jgi:3-isopropylmalate dehydrogenase
MKLNITVLDGDGIGPEVTAQAVRILGAVASVYGYDFRFTRRAIGGGASIEYGSPLPEATRESCLQSDAVLLGAVGGPQYDTLPAHLRPEAGLLALRKELECFANLRPVRVYDDLIASSPLKAEIIRGADIMIVRELLGGLYFGNPRGFDADGSAAFNTMRYSKAEVERVAVVAFELARQRRRRVTSVDKSNVLECSRLWRETVTQVATRYPDVHLEHALVDSFAMSLIMQPTAFDVVLTENLFGDILSDESAVLAGSLGMLASASVGGKVDLYEPIHGSAPTIAGKNIANPVGAIASAAMLLRHTAKLTDDAEEIERAISRLFANKVATPDIANAQSGWQVASTVEVGNYLETSLSDALDRKMAYHAV